MAILRSTSTALAVLAVASLARAQAPANDDCANAISIMTGLTAVDNSLATTDGLTLDVLVCDMGPFGTEDIFNDVWYEFTPAATDDYVITTFGLAGFDTRLAVYDQVGCPDDPNNVVACNDDFDGAPPFEAGLQVNLIGGTSYLVRLGNFSAGTAGGAMNLSVEAFVPPSPMQFPGNGNYYLAVPEIGITWDDARLAAEAATFMGVQGRLATITDQAENDFIYGSLGGVHRHWVGGFQDLTSPSYSEPGGGWSWITGEPFTYTNWLVGEPNDTGAFASEDFLELLDDFTFGQTWNDVHPMEHPEGYVIEFDMSAGGTAICNGDGGDQMGCTNCPCGNNAAAGTIGGCVNSSSTSARLFRSGSGSVTGGDLRMEMDGGVPASFAVLTSGDAVAPQNAANPCFGLNSGVQAAVLDGLRCAVQSTQRHGGRPVAADGTVGMGLTNGWGPPNGPPGGLAAQGGFVSGDTRFYQVFYRELPGTVCLTEQNTTQAEGVTFTP